LPLLKGRTPRRDRPGTCFAPIPAHGRQALGPAAVGHPEEGNAGRLQGVLFLLAEVLSLLPSLIKTMTSNLPVSTSKENLGRELIKQSSKTISEK